MTDFYHVKRPILALRCKKRVVKFGRFTDGEKQSRAYQSVCQACTPIRADLSEYEYAYERGMSLVLATVSVRQIWWGKSQF